MLFGELLPAAAIDRAFALAEASDLMLCCGSSLEVHPVAGLPDVVLERGGVLAILTDGPTPYDDRPRTGCTGPSRRSCRGSRRWRRRPVDRLAKWA